MQIIDGRAIAQKLRERTREDVASLSGVICFHAILVGDNPASKIYITMKQKACAEVGIDMHVTHMPQDTTQKTLNNHLAKLSAATGVHGILLQLPLPDHLDARNAIAHINPLKDVDGLTIENFGHLTIEGPKLSPCTALGIVHILHAMNIEIAGKDITVIGRSNIVGKPTALLLMSQNATVTVCHSGTRDLGKHTANADIIIVAAGCPGLLTPNMVRHGAIVIDVGINRLPNGKVVGDADFEGLQGKVSMITPVPGGVGPLTIAFLLENIVQSYRLQQ
ncbi:MAG: bifunctional 5,10-methylenetetrahydrofolate dehydrogenase/5,10-methenyltetrahydrofolate cyclohydrolase [Firmicutes bacterium]|nr:bifunctional 5,10-methylenetetrahydrofolate dehydrogenase/5,10-methenyltetrahydrofolate cyclohydrolase [Bacillota bacterium]